jgi:polyketide-type polyunsaturated fatty acid synthase PfaA
MVRSTIMKNKFEPIAIVGVSALFPAAINPTEFWLNIITGKDLITDVPATHWLIDDYYDADPNSAKDKTYCKRGAFLPAIDFDPLEYGVPPNTIPAIDTSQLLSLIVAKQVLQDATQDRYQTMDLSRTSVILGTSALEALTSVSARMQQPVLRRALNNAGLTEDQIQHVCKTIEKSYTDWQEDSFPGLLSNVVAGRIANRFNLGGTNCITDAACAGSLAALHLAVQELQTKTADLVITGGVDTLNDIVMYMCFSKTKALSTTGDCRPFSDQANGTVLGEGIGMFALKRLQDAEQQNDQIYAVIKGVGTSSDGRAKSIYAPLAQGQANAIARAYEQAQYPSTSVELIEAHGTGTKAGDVAEFQGLSLAFAAADKINQKTCALGSIKSQIGHTKSAAGAAGLFKAVMALHHKVLPPTIKIDAPNPNLNLDQSPFYLNTKLRPWLRRQQQPRRAGVSAFGFGGSNYHIALEEYVGNQKKPARLRTFPHELIIYTAKDATSLLDKLKQELTSQFANKSLVELAFDSQINLQIEHSVRLAMVATDVTNLTMKVIQAIALIEQNPKQAFSLHQGIYYGVKTIAGQIALVFPGEENAYLDMSADLAMNFSAVMSVLDHANEIVHHDNLNLA